MKKTFLILLIAIGSILPDTAAFGLTLDEAVVRAKDNYPTYRASQFRVKASEARHSATLGPYFPSLDTSASYSRHYTSIGDFDNRTFNMTASWMIFDGFRREANRDISEQNMLTDMEGLRRSETDLVYQVKASFYTALAQNDTVEFRRTQLKDAEKDLDVATGRHKYGIAKLLDVLQASVRHEQAKLNLVQSEGDLRKAYSDLNSLLGERLENIYPLEGSLEDDSGLPERAALVAAALQRPEIRQAEAAVKISESSRTSAASEFFPTISLNAAYDRFSGGGITFTLPEDKSVSVKATWNIFELGKFFRHKATGIDVLASRENLENARRQARLDVFKAYEDMLIARNRLALTREQIRQAELNYNQALGEYKVGTADILSLVQAESALAAAREQFVVSRLTVVLSRIFIERAAGVRSIETMKP